MRRRVSVKRTLARLAAAALLSIAAAAYSFGGEAGAGGGAGGGGRTISVDEIRPGMRGWGLTDVGDGPERFEAEVLGVLRGIAPKRDAILVRLSGLDLERTGIFGGMSGSPVYFDERLAGAVAFGWGWPKDPIAGVTPIAEMEAAFEAARTEPAAAASWEDVDILAMLERRAWGVAGGEASPAGSSPAAGPLGSEGAPVIVTSGVGKQALEIAKGFFSEKRFVFVEGAAGARAPREVDGGAELAPGSTVYAGLVSGDMFMGAVGTVVDVRGGEVYAFGHPFLDTDNVAMPMYTGEVLAVFPSSFRSFKIAAPLVEVGAFTRDRATGVLGVLGHESNTFPVRVTVERGGEKSEYNYAVYRHYSMSGGLAATAAAASVTTLGALPAEATLSYRLYASYEGGRSFDMTWRAAGGRALSAVAGDTSQLLSITMKNPLEYLSPLEMRLDVKVEPGDFSATIESAKLLKAEVYPGETLEVLVTLKPNLADEVTVGLAVKVPLAIEPGRKAIVICSGGTSDVLDLKEATHRLRPGTIDELLEAMRPRRGPGTLVARLSGASFGLARKGQEFPNLTPGMLAVLAAPEESSLSPLYSSVLGAVPTEYVLSGRKLVSVTVKAPLEK